MTALAFTQTAQSYLGTPFHHQGRLPGVGLDCIGLVVCALKASHPQLDIHDRTNYLRLPTGSELKDSIASHGIQVFDTLDEAQLGDLLIFRFGNRPQHVAIYLGEDKIIHAYQPAGKVVEITMNDSWKSRFLCGYNMQEIL